MLNLRPTDISIGIDPSLTGTAVCLGVGDGFFARRFPSVKVDGGVSARIQRINDIVADVVNWIEDRCGDRIPSACFLEGYAHAGKKLYHTGNLQVEFGGVLRSELIYLTRHIYEVLPKSLKRFTAGTGKADKSQMTSAVRMLYGHRFATDDEVDACALYYMGRIISGAEPARCERQEAMIGDYEKIIATRT